MNKYDIREFNEWLKDQPSDKIYWSIDSSIKCGDIKNYFFDKLENIHLCTKTLIWDNNHLSVLEKWINIKENSLKREMEIKKNLIKNSIDEIKKLRLKHKELNDWKIKVKEEELEIKSNKFRKKINFEITNCETTWSYKRGYFIIILDCYERLLINKNDKSAKEIFDKYKDLMINYRFENRLNVDKAEEHECLFNEILELKTEIFNLNEELKSIEANNLIESLERLIIEKNEDNHSNYSDSNYSLVEENN